MSQPFPSESSHDPRMPYLIGTDEAGYGPRLGPLLISLSLWRVEQPPQEVDLFTALADTVCATGTKPGDNRLKIDDSKKLYQSGGSVRGLERPVLSALQALHRTVETWRDAWHLLVGQTPTALKELPWYCDYDESLPIDTEKDDVAHLATQWKEQWRATQCELLELRSIPLFPAELNKEIDALDSKAETLTRATLRLIADVLEKRPAEETLIVCDKHGGRNHYLPALQRQFPENLVRVLTESRSQSRYRFDAAHQSAEICFRRQGESFLPTALASLASKYLRELAMRAFNRYWAGRVGNLKPTAGYPADAVRFRQTIEPLCGKSGLPLHAWWRIR